MARMAELLLPVSTGQNDKHIREGTYQNSIVTQHWITHCNVTAATTDYTAHHQKHYLFNPTLTVTQRLKASIN